MTNTNITSFRKNIFSFVDQAVTYGEVINVNTKNGKGKVRGASKLPPCTSTTE